MLVTDAAPVSAHSPPPAADAAREEPQQAAARASGGPTFLNLDMEEYADLRLTVDAFTRLLTHRPDLANRFRPEPAR